MIAELQENPLNWRSHPDAQRELIRDILSRIGWVSGIIVNERTGRIIDGHMRVEEARRAGDLTVPATFVDLSDEEERDILALVDNVGSLHQPDDVKLLELVREAQERHQSGAISQLLIELGEDAEFRGVSDDEAGDEDNAQAPPRPLKTVSLVVALQDIPLLERALTLASKKDQASALPEILTHYVQRQHHASSQDLDSLTLAARDAEAVRD